MKNIVVCVNVNEKSFNGLEKMKEFIEEKNVNLTLLHVWDRKAYDYPGEMIVAFYPNYEQSIEIEQELKKQLDGQVKYFKDLKVNQFNTFVFSSSTPKSDTVEYLKKQKADLVVCLSEQKGTVENFFHSSFTNYLSAYAPCDVLTLRI